MIMKSIRTKRSRMVVAVALTLALAMTPLIAAPGYAAVYTDTQGHWAESYIDFAVSRNLIAGTTATTFSPEIPITRAEFVRALGVLTEARVAGYTSSSFTDVSVADPAMPYIEWAAATGIVQGMGDGTFQPGSAITREAMSVMMKRCADVLGKGPQGAWMIHLGYADTASISDWALEGVTFCSMHGIMTGRPGNVFDPRGQVTRAETCAILQRFEGAFLAPTPEPEAVAIASVSVNRTTINAGDSVTLTIRTNSIANNVWVEFDNTNANAALQSTDTHGVKTWTVGIAPKESQKVRIYANTSKTSTGAARETQQITVNGRTASIIDINANTTSVELGESVEFNIRTSADVTTVWAVCDGRDVRATAISTSGGEKRWRVHVTPSATQRVFIYASSSNSTVKDYVQITVRADVPPSADNLVVQFYTNPVSETDPTLGTEVHVITKMPANFVWFIMDVDDNNLSRYADYVKTEGGHKEWRIVLFPTQPQKVRLYADPTETKPGTQFDEYFYIYPY